MGHVRHVRKASEVELTGRSFRSVCYRAASRWTGYRIRITIQSGGRQTRYAGSSPLTSSVEVVEKVGLPS